MTAPGGPRRRHQEEEAHENHERWLVSYSDMITVLMALFIVLFAISQVDQEKYQALAESLAAGFSGSAQGASILDGSDGVLDPAVVLPGGDQGSAGLVDADAGLGEQGTDPRSVESLDRSDVDRETWAAARVEVDHLRDVQTRITDALVAVGLADTVRFRINEDGLVMGLVADDVFFAPASAELTETAQQVLDAAAPTLVPLSEQIAVEGHANIVPVAGRYPTNWELSADRATQVLRRLVEIDGLPPHRAEAVGYGDTRPLAPGDSDEALAANRRVDIVIVSTAPETVRALLPAVAGEDTEG